tara:strand:+ start:191 stop:457 length:267 start_codon:yes stop_codon:yes gene_type:complete
MNRKTIKTRTGAYHVTLPIRLVERFDQSLAFKASRSKTIARLIDAYLDGSEIPVSAMTATQLIAAAMAQLDRNSTEYIMLETVHGIIS